MFELRCWHKDKLQRPLMDQVLYEMTNHRISQKLSTITDIVDLRAIFENRTISEIERVQTYLQLINISNKNVVDVEQLKYISNIINYTNKLFPTKRQSITTDNNYELSQTYKHRLELINSLTMAQEMSSNELWLERSLLLYHCFYHHPSQFVCENCTEFDRQICQQIRKLTIDKMRFFLSDQVWMHIDRISFYSNFTRLLIDYDIKIDSDDWKLLNDRFDEMNMVSDKANRREMKQIAGRLQRIEEMRSLVSTSKIE